MTSRRRGGPRWRNAVGADDRRSALVAVEEDAEHAESPGFLARRRDSRQLVRVIALALVLAVAQSLALVVVVARLLPGRRRSPPPRPTDDGPPGAVTVLVPTLDEARRIEPCLRGLRRQGAVLDAVLVIDSGSRDGTADAVRSAAALDPRIELLDDGPLPDGWIGKVWALQQGLARVRTPWVLGLDADVEPEPGLVGGALRAAQRYGLDVVSFGPRFAGQDDLERWLQPALLAGLVLRTGAAGSGLTPGVRVLANGQCFLARREVLERHGGYAVARASFCDDVTLARHLARAGARVGFLDGSSLFRVRAYASAADMWREWGRSLDLKDARTATQQLADVALLGAAQGLPLLVLLSVVIAPRWAGALAVWLVSVNVGLFAMRCGLHVALRRSYEVRGIAFWLSPLADPLAFVRVLTSSLRRPRSWRGRRYEARLPTRTDG